MSINLKTPLSYYGGKQSMLGVILPKIPAHKTYVEGFAGGGAVFFAKPPAEVEVINDLNQRIVAFYKTLKYDFDQFAELVDETFYSRQQYKESYQIYKAGADEVENPLLMAWAIWAQGQMAFGAQMCAGFSYDRKNQKAKKLHRSKNMLTDAYQERMKSVTIENKDVIKVIKYYDSPETFFYLDPPYVSADQGHYKGYSAEAFRQLLEACAGMKGKFLLSSYLEPDLVEFRKQHGWQSQDLTRTLARGAARTQNDKKVECLTWNY